jgi:hypothetical protein
MRNFGSELCHNFTYPEFHRGLINFENLFETSTSIIEAVEQSFEETGIEKPAIETAIWRLIQQGQLYQPQPGKARREEGNFVMVGARIELGIFNSGGLSLAEFIERKSPKGGSALGLGKA